MTSKVFDREKSVDRNIILNLHWLRRVGRCTRLGIREAILMLIVSRLLSIRVILLGAIGCLRGKAAAIGGWLERCGTRYRPAPRHCTSF